MDLFLDLHPVEQYQNLSNRLLVSKASVHSWFIFFVALINFVWLFTSSRPFTFYPYILVTLTLQLAGIYAGRWIYKRYFYWDFIGRFISYSSVLTIMLSFIGVLIFFAVERGDDTYFTKYYLISFFNVLPAVLLGIFMALIRTALRTQMNEAIVIQKQQESELELLLSQLSPHFLFNTLNNLYGLSITNDQKITGLLLKLSELLRYSLYETKNKYVPLEEEIKYIRNYIDLERIRIGNRLIMTADFPASDELKSIRIAPMLLIIFIENSFKHAKDTYDEKIYINMTIKLHDEHIYIEVSNSYTDTASVTCVKENAGLGVVNAMKRLELLYPGAYHFNQQTENGFYKVTLKLKAR